jgi:phosphate starvation-inducible PhoH-like protein
MARTPKVPVAKTPRKRENPEKSYPSTQFKPVQAKTEKQRKLLQSANDFQIVAATGCAGTGKSHILVAFAAQELYYGRTEKIVITRPASESCEESLGFLPGTIEEKYEWVVAPVRLILEKTLGKGNVEMFFKNGMIEALPLAYMRGHTFDNAIVIADEMQNSTPAQAEMLMTRIGENSKLFITGDVEQSDVKGTSGLEAIVKYALWMPYAKQVDFGLDDIVRSHMTADIIKSFREYRKDARVY